MGVDDSPYNCQPQSNPLARSFCLPVPIEDALYVTCSNTATPVDDGNLDECARALRGHDNRTRRVTELDRVAEQVAQRLYQPCVIGEYGR